MRETLVKSEEFEDSPIEKIPKDWEIVSLKNEINILHGYAFEGEYFADEPPGDVLLVPGNFHRDGGLYFDDNNTKYYRGLIPDGTVLENGQLLIVMTDLSPRTLILGRVVLLELPFRVLHNQRIGKIVPKLPNTWDKRFLLLVMNSDTVRRNIISNATGTTVRHTSPDRIIANVVPKPPVEEQSKIADILDTIDVAIAHTSSLIAKLKQMKAGLLHDLLTRGLDENGELRDAIAHPEQFKESPLGQVPKDWEVVPIQQAAAQVPGATTIGPFGSNLLASDYRSVGVPVTFVRDIKADGFQWNSNIYVEPKKARELSAHSVQSGDLLATKMGLPPCIACVYPEWMASGIITADIIRLRPNTQIYTSQWLSLFVNSHAVIRQVRGITGGITRDKITLHDFRKLLIALPRLKEQKQITNILDTYNSRICCEEAYREKLKLQKQGLMHHLLTGKVRVKNA